MSLRPRSDDRRLWDIDAGLWQSLGVLVAHDLKLFVLLNDKPRTVPEVCTALQIASRPAAALLNTCAAAGLLQTDGVSYALTPLAEDYLVPGGPAYRGAILDASIAYSALLTFDSLKRAVLTDTPQIHASKDLFQVHEEQSAEAMAFTHEMHANSLAAAQVWPEALDLSQHRRMLDVGGGSGVHSIAAAQRWPSLEAVIFDLATVCTVAEEYIQRAGLPGRIRTTPGDMWNDPFPAADLHFYSLVYHDWPPAKCRVLSRKSYASLPPGGRIILHEMLHNDRKNGPPGVTPFDLAMLVWTEGQEYSGQELTEILADTGFVDIAAKPTWGYWGIITGVKPV